MNGYVVTVIAPDGTEREVRLAAEQVELFKGDTKDAYACAAWLAYCDLWMRAEPTE